MEPLALAAGIIGTVFLSTATFCAGYYTIRRIRFVRLLDQAAGRLLQQATSMGMMAPPIPTIWTCSAIHIFPNGGIHHSHGGLVCPGSEADAQKEYLARIINLNPALKAARLFSVVCHNLKEKMEGAANQTNPNPTAN